MIKMKTQFIVVPLLVAASWLNLAVAETRCEFLPEFDMALASISPADLQLGQWKGVSSPEECADLCCSNSACDSASYLRHNNENICVIASCPQEDSCKWTLYSGAIKLKLVKKFDNVSTTTVTPSSQTPGDGASQNPQDGEEHDSQYDIDRSATSIPISTTTESSNIHTGAEDLGSDDVTHDDSQGYPWMTDNNFGPGQQKQTTTTDEIGALDNALKNNPAVAQENQKAAGETAEDKELQEFLENTGEVEAEFEKENGNKPENLVDSLGARKNYTLFNAYFTEIKETGPVVTLGICFGVFFLLLIVAIAGKKVATLSTLKTRVHYKPLRDDSIYQKSYSDE